MTTRDSASVCVCVCTCVCTRVCECSHLVEDEAELVRVQRRLWWVWLAVDQARGQTGHGAVVDDGAELETDMEAEVRPASS